jgi:hypothetical protein
MFIKGFKDVFVMLFEAASYLLNSYVIGIVVGIIVLAVGCFLILALIAWLIDFLPRR